MKTYNKEHTGIRMEVDERKTYKLTTRLKGHRVLTSQLLRIRHSRLGNWPLWRVVPPMTASFHGKVGNFTPLRLNNYHVCNAKLILIAHRIWTWLVGRRPELNSDETCRCERDSY